MEEIKIICNDRTVSRIVSGEEVSGAAGLLEGENAVFVVHDAKAGHIAEKLRSSIGARASKAIEATEHGKTLDTVRDICSWLMENGADRDALVLGIGGGITTDMTGFAASIYKRGVRFALIPTTLLAQVDAAIGGKTGVNLDSYKNMIGVIRQPEWTYICTEALETLPYRQFVNGSAELLKTFIIEDSKEDYTRTVRLLSGINSAESRRTAIEAYRADLTELILHAASVKAGIVGRDQFENGERRVLNLGHTFAHAIEKLSNSGHDSGAPEKEAQGSRDMVDTRAQKGDICHGEAVAMGIVLAARLSEALGIAEPRLAERIRNHFASCGLPVECPFTPEELEDAMKKDKKSENGIIHFVLPRSIGDVIIKDMTAEEAIELLKK